MAVVKISELPAMQQIAGSDILPIVDTSETETKKVTKQMLLTDIDASEVNIGQLNEATQINDEDYLIITQNGLNKKISKANARFASGDEISIGTTQPVEDEKLWINPEDIPSGSLYPITNEYSVATDKGYSCDYVNNANTYSTSEVKTDKVWVDGKPIYRYVYNISSLPNNDSQTYNLSISNIDYVVNLSGIAFNDSVGHFFPLPYIGRFGGSVNDIELTLLSRSQIRIITQSDRSSYEAYVYIEYTKTTD